MDGDTHFSGLIELPINPPVLLRRLSTHHIQYAVEKMLQNSETYTRAGGHYATNYNNVYEWFVSRTSNRTSREEDFSLVHVFNGRQIAVESLDPTVARSVGLITIPDPSLFEIEIV